ncbi:hypothetical protein AGDE_16518 [Angomonas deanei]|nr:hypothetical protein AGDE_16518 [Angomonas deanei]|eukprot:EPY16943.1 hypothetical protein AGDE_16518 [Angomonas deanei]
MSASTNVGFDLSTPMRGARAVSVSGVSPLQASASGSNFASNPVDRSPLTGSLASLPSPGNLVPNNSGGGNETVLFLRYDRILTDLAQRRRKYENYVRQYWTDAFYQPKTEHTGVNPDDSMNTFSAIDNQNLNLNLVPHEREI